MTWTHSGSQSVCNGGYLLVHCDTCSFENLPARPTQFVHSVHRRHSRAHQTRFDTFPKPPLSVVGSIHEPRPQQDSRSRSRGALWWPLLRLTAIDKCRLGLGAPRPVFTGREKLRLSSLAAGGDRLPLRIGGWVGGWEMVDWPRKPTNTLCRYVALTCLCIAKLHVLDVRRGAASDMVVVVVSQ